MKERKNELKEHLTFFKEQITDKKEPNTYIKETLSFFKEQKS